MVEHSFTITIKLKLIENFGTDADAILRSSELIQYLNIKTKSAQKGSKSRGSFANLYAIYVLVEDYLKKGYPAKGDYKDYQGARFSELFERQRELPFGSKLQNHALNHRLNEEFRKYFPTIQYLPIIRDVGTNKYWINERLLVIEANGKKFNLAVAIISIIDQYILAKQDAFDKFISNCEGIRTIEKTEPKKVIKFVEDLLAPNVDARLFEIVSYSILKYYYSDQTIHFGFDLNDLKEENLALYKTGRTNANDGGIDFVMKPLGRFFQVTETTDVRKYFLDIDKIERYPITFVIKSDEPVDRLREMIRDKAEEQYPVSLIVDRYLGSIEEIINIKVLLNRFNEAVTNGYLTQILGEIIKQSKVEFNYEEEEEVIGTLQATFK